MKVQLNQDYDYLGPHVRDEVITVSEKLGARLIGKKIAREPDPPAPAPELEGPAPGRSSSRSAGPQVSPIP